MLKNWTLLILASSAPAVASPDYVVVEGERRPTIAVSFGGLDLTRERDIERLRQRASSAAREVCRPQVIEIPAVKAEARACFEATRANAYSEIERVASTMQRGQQTDLARIVVRAQTRR